MYYFVTIVYNVTSGNTTNLLSMAIYFEMSEGRLNVSLFLWKTNN